jgi:hypothetical protein
MSNARRLLFEGRTYPELNYCFDEYLIPAFWISLYAKFNIGIPDLEFNNYINLLYEKFEEDAIYILKRMIYLRVIRAKVGRMKFF